MALRIRLYATVATLLVIIVAALMAPTDLIDRRGSLLRGMVGSYASAGSFELKVHWTKDSTVNPAVARCSTSGAVGGAASVHISFNPPDNSISATIKDLRIHEDAGHTTDIHQADQPFSNSNAHVDCGDPDPDNQNSPRMMYHDHMWPTTGGHNGSHIITAAVEYTTMTMSGTDPPTYSTQTSTVTKTITVDVENLVITSTSPVNPERN